MDHRQRRCEIVEEVLPIDRRYLSVGIETTQQIPFAQNIKRGLYLVGYSLAHQQLATNTTDQNANAFLAGVIFRRTACVGRALNEVIEFFATLSMPKTNVGGYINTGWDLVANLVGSSAAALLIYSTQREKAA